MKIIRVIDKEYFEFFSDDSILKRNCFVVLDNERVYSYEFFVVKGYKANIKYNEERYLSDVIDDFRYYNYRVSEFYCMNNSIIKVFDKVKTTNILIDSLQPSQFYIDEFKLSNIKKWIEDEDVTIPIVFRNNKNIVIDGHTRLYALKEMNYKTVNIYLDEYIKDGIYIDDFVNMCIKRNIYRIDDLQLLNHKDYNILWNKFCDEYFNTKR